MKQQLDAAPPPAPIPWERARVSTVLANLFQPGTGHLLIGRRGRAVFWALTAQVLPLASIVIGVMLLAPAWLLAAAVLFMPAAYIASMIDVGVIRRHAPPLGNRWTRTAAVVGACLFGATPFFALKELAVEIFNIQGHSMLPALLGTGFDEACPTCGRITRASARPEDPHLPTGDWELSPSWCAKCDRPFGGTEIVSYRRLGRSDRVFVNKFRRTPARWDLVVYRNPQTPTVPYVHRVVGLPGERLEFVEGELLVNGRIVPRPADLVDRPFREISYPFYNGHASAGNPVTLADDEYFVVGDNSGSSLDSRYWETGAPGRPPYAVPADHIIGTVTHIIWPPARWRVFAGE